LITFFSCSGGSGEGSASMETVAETAISGQIVITKDQFKEQGDVDFAFALLNKQANFSQLSPELIQFGMSILKKYIKWIALTPIVTIRHDSSGLFACVLQPHPTVP